ncbi:hypothetical protein ACHAW5_001099 [Stephanodiscus triporus]|uniref:SET domain-containing protein n=1 Tax=Stephanodiscus triporus TaxID=2934178 RepID=A0ABD3PWF7_9STRA
MKLPPLVALSFLPWGSSSASSSPPSSSFARSRRAAALLPATSRLIGRHRDVDAGRRGLRRPSSVVVCVGGGGIVGIDDEGGDDDDVRRRTLDAALVKMRSIDEVAFGSRFNGRRMRLVEVRESSIPGAGLGLFARSSIRSGTIITFYPVHSIGIVDAVDGGVTRVCMDAGTGRTYERPDDDDDDDAYLLHVLGGRPLMDADVSRDLGGRSIFVDVDVSNVDPRRIGDGGAIASCGFDGHGANDGGGALAYYRALRAARNCVHVPFGPSPLLALVSTRKIRRGDELLTTYGCSYWLDSLMRETGESEETDMTESILVEAREVAMDILKGMRSAAATHASEAEELRSIFDAR